MRKILLLLVCAAVLSATTASASPVTTFEFAFEISGHRWGVWMIDGIPSHDLLSKAFRDAEWLNSRTDSDDSQPFYSYFVIGLGQFGAVYLSIQLCVVLLLCIVVSAGVLIRKHKQRANKAE